MKKFGVFMCSLALAGFVFTSCDDPNNGNKNDIDNLVEDGFYAVGEACPIKSVTADDAVKAQMAQGINEVDMNENNKTWDESKRDGMYEKYIYLEAGKDFQLVLKEGNQQTIYGAELAPVTLDGEGDQPKDVVVYKGKLAENTKMQMKEAGLYHIVLDLNKDGALDLTGGAQIVIVPVKWGVSGGMNSWGLTDGAVEVKSATEIVWTWKDQELAANGEFKFKNQGWKIVLDDAGKVKAHLNLGADMKNGGDNIKVEKAGLYDITLTYTLSKGEIANNYKYEAKLTQESTLPTTMYMIGQDFGEWKWEDAGVVEMTPVHSHAGMFWCTRYIANPANGFKFCATKAWNGDFTGLTTNEGFEQKDNNCFVAEAGLYTMLVDLKESKLTIYKAAVYGIGDAFGSWDEAKYPFVLNEDGTATITATAAGNLRMYSEVKDNTGNWWQSEFNIYDGKIVYRAGGGDQEAVSVAAGAKVTLNFNEGTGEIK